MYKTPENISPTQIKFINNMTKRLDINVIALIQSETDAKNINDVKYKESLGIQEKLSAYVQDMTSIPDELRGYDENWLNNFGGKQ